MTIQPSKVVYYHYHIHICDNWYTTFNMWVLTSSTVRMIRVLVTVLNLPRQPSIRRSQHSQERHDTQGNVFATGLTAKNSTHGTPAVGHCSGENPAWLTCKASINIAFHLKTETDLLCLVMLTFHLSPSDLKINGFPGLTVQHVHVKFGDPSCISL